MKKLLSMLIALIFVLSCGVAAFADEGSEPDWTGYDALIAEIKACTDFAEREALMHQAEDILMETNCIMPLYYYNDLYMQKESVDGIYTNLFQTKFFQYATNGDSDTMAVNLASEPDHLDPALNSSVDGACLAALNFAGLYTYNAEGVTVPNLAEGYTVSEDGLTYVFTVKDGLKWSDGTDLTAADFEYSWKRAVAPETAADYAYMFDCIEGFDYEGKTELNVTAEGNTLTVVLKAPCAYMLDLVAFPTYFAVPKANIESANADGNNPEAWCLDAGFVGSGAYVCTEWKHNESMTYTKNPYFWDADNCKLETITFMLSADDTAIYSAYQAGDVDFIDTVPNDLVETLMDDPEFHVISALGTYYAACNIKSDLFAGKTVEQANAMRAAFNCLIDRQYIVDAVGQCGQIPATSFIPAGMMDGNGGIFKVNDDDYTYPVDDGYLPIEPDVDHAIELLEFAGYEFDENGMLSAETPINVEYLTNDGTGHIAIAECIQQDLAVVGINMTIRSCEWNVFLNDRKNGNYDFSRNGWVADFNDPINMLEMWTTDSGNNDCQFGR